MKAFRGHEFIKKLLNFFFIVQLTLFINQMSYKFDYTTIKTRSKVLNN